MDVPPNRAVRPSDRVFHGLIAAALAAMFAVTLIPPDRAGWRPTFAAADEGGRPLCLLRYAGGIPCPTCGMTRSFRCIGQGMLGDALAFHPLGPALYAVFAVVMVRSAGVALRGRTWLDRTAWVLVWSIPVLAGATVLVWAVRLACFVESGAAAEAWRASLLGRFAALVF